MLRHLLTFNYFTDGNSSALKCRTVVHEILRPNFVSFAFGESSTVIQAKLIETQTSNKDYLHTYYLFSFKRANLIMHRKLNVLLHPFVFITAN